MTDPNVLETRHREVISFRVGSEEFCVDIMSVREIRGWTPPTPLPHAPVHVRGVINLRGTVLPVIDMGVRLGLAADAHNPTRVVIVVWIAGKLVGLLVDAVSDILNIAPEALQPVPSLAGDTLHGFINAVLTIDDRMICMIALDQLVPELATVAA
jgi:purine-binding chemotaxis protein CheW